MNRQMTLKGASAKAQPEGNVLVRLSMEVITSADMARDILMEAGELLDQEVNCEIKANQSKIEFKGPKG